MPRKNKFHLIQPSTATTDASSMLSPAEKLTSSELAAFNAVVASNRHLQAGDRVLLTAFARVSSWVMRAKIEDPAYERTVRSMVTLGRALRINSASTLDPKVAFRKRNAAPASPIDEYFARCQGEADAVDDAETDT